jgi:hypothetical protein
MQIKLNMKDIGNRFEPVPDDVYKVRITAVDDNGSDKGPWCKLDLVISEGEFAEKRQLNENVSFADSALWNTKIFLEAVTGMKWADDDMDFDTQELINLEGYIMTKQETYPKKDGSGDGVKSVVDHWIINPNPAVTGV